jgi:hypothetical protein
MFTSLSSTSKTVSLCSFPSWSSFIDIALPAGLGDVEDELTALAEVLPLRCKGIDEALDRVDLLVKGSFDAVAFLLTEFFWLLLPSGGDPKYSLSGDMGYGELVPSTS